MKKYILAAGLMALVSSQAWAGEMPAGWTPPKQSAELQLIKTLEGHWEGISDEKGHPGHEGEKVMVDYHVTSGGSAVEETLGKGTSHEMVSVYHDVKGKLSMTHYCMVGNQPKLELKNASAGKLTLGETAASAALLSGEMRMGSLVIEMPDASTLIQTWTSTGADGKPMESSVFKFKKV